MRRKVGFALILAGLFLLVSALGLYLHNREEEKRAVEFVEEVVPQMVEIIEQQREGQTYIPGDPQSVIIQNEKPNSNREMPVKTIGEYGYIGYLSIPKLELALPIMSNWSYPQLKIAPCRYAGSLYLDNLVLMAHNYDKHFGRIDELRAGDRIVFVDMDGVLVEYEVVALDVLSPTDIEEMIEGNYDLTLFTCTYGGKSRVTVRCSRITQYPMYALDA